MRRPSATLARRVAPLFAAVVATAALTGIPAAQSAQAATDRLPDLRMARLSEFRIQTTPSGRRLLRFSTMMTNHGAGPFVVRSTRHSRNTPWRVQQVIHDSARHSRRITVGATMTYGGDGHGHWHVDRMIDIDLWSASQHARGSKIGFCFFDTTAVNRRLPRSPGSAVYRESGCARRTQLASTMGISVGWGDRYQWSLPFQWVDITGLPNGDYRLRAMVDARNLFVETSDTNNCAWSRLRITGSRVSVLDAATTCTNDYGSLSQAADIAWAMASGVIPGCGVDLFCPRDTILRHHAARFLDGAIHPPETADDFFDDDAGHPDEAAINRLAAAGVLDGCGERLFCPALATTRAGMASMLSRAFALPEPTIDPFVDDEAEQDEDAINRVAERGIMTACAEGPDRFCPAGGVNRTDLAGFLRRAMGG